MRFRDFFDTAASRNNGALEPDDSGGTVMTYAYEAAIGGKIVSIGGRLLDGATKVIIGQFFAALARHAGGGARARSTSPTFFRWLLEFFGGGR